MADASTGTTTRVQGPVKYPSRFSLLVHLLWHLRGSFLAAVFCVHVVYAEWALPALVRWFHTHTLIQDTLQQAPAALWVKETFLTGRTDGKNMEDAALFVLGTVLIHLVMYTVLNGFFALCSATGFLSKYRLPRSPRMKLGKGLVFATLREAFVNQLVTGPIVIFFIYLYIAHFRSLLLDPTSTSDMTPPPSLIVTWYHLAMASLVNEVLFYAAHRAFHEVPGLYVRFHKQHHRYVGSIGIAAEYAHPLEQIFANQGPTAAYMLFMSSQIDTALWFTWLAWRLWETYEAHSGYCFTGSWLSNIGLTYGERARFHDWHHSDNRGCYGVFWIDYLLGTMDSYAQHLQASEVTVTQKKKTA